MTQQFNVGDTVLVYEDHHDKTPVQSKVVRVTKRTVVLGNGQKFTTSGDEWGNSDAWFHRYIKTAKGAS